MIPDFDDIVKECYALHKAKSSDYANEIDPYLNFRITGLTGISARLVDKAIRLFTIYQNKKINVKDETIEDTLKDLIVLSIIGLSWYRNEEPDKIE